MRFSTEFQKKVCDVVKKIPRGKILSYQEVAFRLDEPGAARAVGNALNRNFNSDVPCHRVIKSDGSVGGYRGGIKKKIKILRGEGVKIKNGKIVNF
jgi:O-6-methylguanine DNA methyltransferase